MTDSRKECDSATRVDVARGLGDVVDEAALRAASHHLETCRHCSAERRVIDLLESGDPHQLAKPRDSDGLERLVDTVLERHRTDRVRLTKKGNRKLAIGVLVGAAAAAAAVVLVSATLLPGESELSSVARIQPLSAKEIGARLAFVSQDVHLGLADARAGAQLGADDMVRTGQGNAVVGFQNGVVLAIRPHSRLTVRASSSDRVSVALGQGALLASVDRGQLGRSFSVETRLGRVTVLGTVFAVEDDGQTVKVGVRRGRVSFEQLDGTIRVIEAGGGRDFPEGVKFALSDEERRDADSALRLFSVLDFDGGALLALTDRAAYATLKVDGISLGATPLEASLRPGKHALAISSLGKASHAVVRELREGERVTELFESVDQLALLAAEDAGIDSGRPGAQDDATAQWREGFLQARDAIAAGRYADAAAVYENLIALYPNATDTGVVYVSLGRIYLDHLGWNAAALQSYTRYLEQNPEGPLAPEALFGRCRALRNIGRIEEEKSALELFAARFPGAIQMREVHKRLAELAAPSRKIPGDVP